MNIKTREFLEKFKDYEPEDIREYLDDCITFWRDKRDKENCKFAKYYIDAFQSVRISIFKKTKK